MTGTGNHERGAAERSRDTAREEPPRMTTAQLFGGVRELIIDHRGDLYRLRITSKGKLILTK